MNAVKALNHPYQESAITCLASALSTNRQTFNNVSTRPQIIAHLNDSHSLHGKGNSQIIMCENI